MALVKDHDFNIMQQSHGLFAIAKLLVTLKTDASMQRSWLFHSSELATAKTICYAVNDPTTR